MTTKKTLVTGATGFVGKRLCRYLLERNYFVRMAVRNQEKALQLQNEFQKDFANQFDIIIVGEIDEKTDWSQAVLEMNSIVHLAARVHVMNETAQDPLTEFRKVNVAGTLNLAKAAIDADIERIVYISSIKVNGEQTNAQHPYFSEKDQPNPQDPYGVSKYEAEQCLFELLKNTKMKVTCLRPPLIYGAGVKGNFEKMLQKIAANKMIPLGKIDNQRSLLYVEHFCSAIEAALLSQEKNNEVFLVADNDPVSSTDLIRYLGIATQKTPKLIPLPKSLLYFVAKLLGKTAMLDRLYGSLVIDNSKIKNELNWQPQYTMQEAFKKEFGK